MPHPTRIAPLAFALALAAPVPAGAQRDTIVVAGAQYAKGAPYRTLFGAEYRRLWTTPITVPLLELRTYAGGLTPVSSGGGFQTKSLWLRGADGLLYGFHGHGVLFKPVGGAQMQKSNLFRF